MSGLLPAPERVLPTLNADGSRNRIRPKLYRGAWYRRRLWTGWLLIVLFVALPFVRIGGHPVVLLDVPGRKFHLFGQTFLPTDGVLLMLLLLSIFLAIVLVTAALGRAWCGWACPQTVYMELLFRPIERLLEGDRSKQLRLDKRGAISFRRVLKNVVFFVLSIFVANVFLAYFVGVDALSEWMRKSPWEQPTPFLVMATTAGLVFLDFAYFREQMCTVACPYARLQSVLLDKDSIVIGYDEKRGEPRSHGKPREGRGDCIDCKACVVACPTGIDIREGLQLECIACAQCVDACNTIMPKIGRPPDLIRYGAASRFSTGDKKRLFRPRVIVYAVLLFGLVATLVVVGRGRGEPEITVLRGIGAPYVVDGETVRNQIRVKVVNRTDREQAFRIGLVEAPDVKLIAPENPLPVPAGRSASTTLFVVAERSQLPGQRSITVRIESGDGFRRDISYNLVGPRPEASVLDGHTEGLP